MIHIHLVAHEKSEQGVYMNNYEFLDRLVKRASKGKLILLMIILAIWQA